MSISGTNDGEFVNGRRHLVCASLTKDWDTMDWETHDASDFRYHDLKLPLIRELNQA